MENILFICNTHYQILIALFLKNTNFKESNVDLIVTDHIKDGENIVESIKKTKVFRKVFYEKTKSDFQLHKLKYKIINKLFPSKSSIAKYISEEKYDEFFLYNIDLFSEIIFAKLQRNNKKIVVNLFDEGISTYSKVYSELLYGEIKRNKLNKILYKLFKRDYIANAAKFLYLVDPDLISWDFKGEVRKITVPDLNKLEIKKIVNEIYSLNKIEEVYDSEYIIFEESFYADGKQVNDLEIFREVLMVINSSDVLIKIHPRNTENRYESLNVKINENISVPWEVILLNLDRIENKKFITITSTAAITALLLYKFKYKIILLYEYKELQGHGVSREYFEVLEKISAKYEDNIVVPRDREELELYLR